jgi:hypothetical protein
MQSLWIGLSKMMTMMAAIKKNEKEKKGETRRDGDRMKFKF